jgi:hypothetical protein
LTRVPVGDYVEEMFELFLETRAPLYRQKREEEIKWTNAFKTDRLSVK